MQAKRFYIIAGEASGDLHGSNLVRQLHKQAPGSIVRAWGGDLMEDAGSTIVKHYRELAFMGFFEVILNLRTILSNISLCKKDIVAFKPDAIIYIDYPGFNLRIAKWAEHLNVPQYYYISPQLWAWKANRVHLIKKVIRKMFVVLPFEVDFYKKYDYAVEFVGHPLLDVTHNYEVDTSFLSNLSSSTKPLCALLPGSRKQEISTLLPIMLKAINAEEFQDFQFVIAQAPSQSAEFYQSILKGFQNIECQLIPGHTYDLLSKADLALVTSGTATLETALFKTPQIVLYKGNAISYQIAKRIVDVPYISLVNLIADEKIVEELIQSECTATNIRKVVREMDRQKMIEAYQVLHERLGGEGASRNTANKILNDLNP